MAQRKERKKERIEKCDRAVKLGLAVIGPLEDLGIGKPKSLGRSM